MFLRLISNGYLPMFQIVLRTWTVTTYRWIFEVELTFKFHGYENHYLNQRQPWRFAQKGVFLDDDYEIPF